MMGYSKKPLLSIVVPIYNGERFIDRCLRKIINLGIDKEIIVINDASNDSTRKILESYGNDIILINNKVNQGVSNARNVGLQIAKGKYITFVDIDDDFEPDIHKKMLNSILTSDSDICMCDFDTITIDNKKIKSVCSIKDDSCSCDTAVKLFLKNKLASGVWAYIFITAIAKKLMFNTNLKTGEDIQFILRYLLKINKISFIDEVMYHYTENSNSAMHVLSPKLIDHIKVSSTLNKDELNILETSYKAEFECFKLEMIKRSVHAISAASKQDKSYAIELLSSFCNKNNCTSIIHNKLIPLYIKIEFLTIKIFGFRFHLFVFPVYNFIRKVMR